MTMMGGKRHDGEFQAQHRRRNDHREYPDGVSPPRRAERSPWTLSLKASSLNFAKRTPAANSTVPASRNTSPMRVPGLYGYSECAAVFALAVVRTLLYSGRLRRRLAPLNPLALKNCCSQAGGQIGGVAQMLTRIFAALTKVLAIHREPGAAFLDQFLGNRHIENIALKRYALVPWSLGHPDPLLGHQESPR